MQHPPILVELQKFVNGVSHGTTLRQPMIKSSIVLLSTLPATRNIVFDFFSVIFDSSVSHYISTLDRDNTIVEDEEPIREIQDALEDLISNGANAWSPLVSNWSLCLLGSLSDKYSGRRSMDIATSCDLWLASPAMRCLLGLAAICFEKLDSDETEVCISNLLATFVKYSPNFDWVVARLGGCFPLKVISKILQCGLKGFSGNQNSTLDSEIGILGYLSCSHEKELKIALVEMIEDVKTNVDTKFKTYTFPYILHLSEMSEVLSQIIVDIFLAMLNDDFINLIKQQYKKWPTNWNASSIIPILSTLVLKTSEKGTTLLLLLATNAVKYTWCRELLEYIMVDLENKLFDDVSPPIMKDLYKNVSKKELWIKCYSENIYIQRVTIRVILLCSYRNSNTFSQALSQLLLPCNNVPSYAVMNTVKRLTLFPLGVNNSDTRNGIFLAFQRLAFAHSDKKKYNIFFENLNSILNVEKSGTHLKKNSITCGLVFCLSSIIHTWRELLDQKCKEEQCLSECEIIECSMSVGKKMKKEHTDPDNFQGNYSKKFNAIHLIAELIEFLDLKNQNYTLKLSDELMMTQLTVKYFFLCLTDFKVSKNITLINRCYNLLARQCNVSKASLSMALRELIEGALFTHRHLFGSQLTDEPFVHNSKEYSLLKANQEQESSSIAFRSLILHAGIIGSGPKLPQKEADGPDADVKNIFINALEACCANSEHPKKIDGYNHISILLIEYLSADVMYNGLVWPEEDFTKVTMERDLQVRRAVLSNPIIWSILGVIAICRPSLCICSVILRALCASVLHQWRARSAENINSSGNLDIMQITVKLLELLSISQMLPPPLDYLYIVVQHLEPPEIAVLLKECVWNFMRDFVPSPMLFGCDISGLHWRDPTVARPPAKFIDPLRNIMQNNITKFGPLYYQMFFMMDLQDSHF